MSGFTETVAEAYAFEGAALDLGRGVHEGKLERDAVVRLPLATSNRHGLIAGATGTGKTRTLQLLAEQLSEAGVSVFAADYKGDVSGLGVPGPAEGKAAERMADLGLAHEPASYPAELLSLGGIGPGVPVRASVTDFGPQLLAKVLGSNETQESSLALVFRYADERGLALVDLADLRALLAFLESKEGKEDLTGIGGVSKQTIGVLLRSLVQLEDGGGTEFFGEPQFEIADLLRIAPDGRGRDLPPRARSRPGEAAPLLDRADVDARRALRAASRGRRSRQAEARLLLRRGASPLRRRDGRVHGVRRANGAHDPLEGRRRVLRDAAPDGHPELRARAARQPRAARASCVHSERRRRAAQDREDLSDLRALRPRAAAHDASASARRR